MAGSGFNATAGPGEFRNHGGPGARSTGAYMIGARPFLAGGVVDAGKTIKIAFPQVTRAITVINKDAASDNIQVHFSSVSSSVVTDASWNQGFHYITLDTKNQSITMNVRSKEIYLTAPGSDASFEIFAELTDIAPARMHTYDSSIETDILATGYKGSDTAKATVHGNACSSEVSEV
jgi:hypothetical protein